MICHGQGDPREDPFFGGCCYVNGAICPHRWFVDYTGLDPVTQTRQAHIYDHNRVDLGTVNAFVQQVHSGAPRQDRVVAAIQGSVYVCGVVANTVIADGIPTGGNWAATFDSAWSAAYQPGGMAADVGDAWEAINKPRNWCVSYGPDLDQCCFREDQATNNTKAAVLSTTRVMVASRSTLGG